MTTMSADIFINFIATAGMIGLWLSIRQGHVISAVERRIGYLALAMSFMLPLRAAFWITGSYALERIALIPAIVVPALILVTLEGLMRRHAPFVMKFVTSSAVVVGCIVLALGHRGFEPWFSYGVAGVQVVTIGFCLLWVWLRDKSKHTAAENRSATILATTLICLALAGVTDFPEIIALPTRLGAVGMLIVAYMLVFVASHSFSIQRTLLELTSIIAMVGIFLWMSTSVLGAETWQAIFQLGTILFSLMLTTVIIVRVFAMQRGVSGASEDRLARADTTDLNAFLDDAMTGPLTPHAFVLRGNDLADYDMKLLKQEFQTTPIISDKTVKTSVSENIQEQIVDIFNQHKATHIFMACDKPPTLVVSAAQPFGDDRELTAYLSLVSKMAKIDQKGQCIMITLKEGDFDSFFEAPFSAYGPDSLYVSPMKADLKRFLSKSENPLFRAQSDITYFTAHRDGHVVGRITAHIHAESNAAFKTNQAYFGYFDCADDSEAATALLNAAEEWGRSKGCSSIAGNYNLTAMQQIGVMVEGFENPAYTDLVYSPVHIKDLLKANGYKAEFPMATFETPFTADYSPPAIGPKQQAILDNPDFEFAPINRKTIAARIEDARVILNASFALNPQFVPVTKREYDFQSKDMKWIIDPRISGVLHYKGQPAACILCIPDLNPLLHKSRSRTGLSFVYHFIMHRLNRKRAVLIYSGVIPELQGQGVNPLVLNHITTAMIDAGYEILGNTWIGATNKASLRQKEKMGARALHELRIFRKALTA